ncbi:hypothetical protein NAT47_03675 [Flavobacterium sp. HXWNR69]|uniref:Lipoprotein n=1 Tax=Flavobacterium fragile TaxID=2949085 RepID=A0ABT0TEV6_9FLAO|nr:hypothetical protein [Flavobacterium sp. HXWNR69]MCL9769508.1 hypothetical protein [Flavobacterium sp. HXWNR69]
MKRIVLLLSLLFLLNSCELDENNFYVDILPVHSVEMPTEFVLGETYQITMQYYRPTNCHSPYGIYYEKDLNVRTCAIKNLVEERGNCAPVENILVEETFSFHVTNTGNYVFKFWTGKDNEGNDTFMTYDIPVN